MADVAPGKLQSSRMRINANGNFFFNRIISIISEVTVLNILSTYVCKYSSYETFPDTFLTALVNNHIFTSQGYYGSTNKVKLVSLACEDDITKKILHKYVITCPFMQSEH